ncbi:hypothetical protein KKC83_03005 [Patescibacteria group bacterium]|nr:hypothetical protein [Candidatus Falkowbacteria bacterium]MBU3905710.1 hypothetical protein [Patescibacteria group bacterium]MCG2698097.1 hypothetical protein [Candidatus Parcubacteria bacterium]MBU4014860.1 hypothetical protein [Patescibacteria group bacterium]MBU4026484.1 hypothetical protein [Patescibacteria group bacterium]
MFKKEVIWREMLYQSIEKNNFNFQQQELAKKFNFSLSTVFNALKIPREIKAIQVSGSGFKLINIEKMLYLWGTHRKLSKDIIYKTFVGEPIEKIEANMPSDIIWASFSAYKYKFKETPSDYGKVYIYGSNIDEIKKRFPAKKGPENLYVLKQDEYLKDYGQCGTLGQIFVDLWNDDSWCAQEFLKKLKERIKI